VTSIATEIKTDPQSHAL